MARLSTAVSLTAFAPDRCEHGHDLRVQSFGPGNRFVSTTPCDCDGIRNDPRKRRFHVVLQCTACKDQGRNVRYYDPPHRG